MTTFIKHLVTPFAVVAALLVAGPVRAQQECQSNADCQPGQICEMTPCATPACDPDDDPNCTSSSSECPSTGVCEDSPYNNCSQDADCPGGFVCEEVGGSDCASAPPCLPGETCPEPPPCEPEKIFACVPAPCTSDADCGGDLVCVNITEEICQGGGSMDCAPDTDCTEPDPPTEPDCLTIEHSFCGPSYIAPCSQDSDCGEGFVCKPEQICSCSAGGATPTDPPSSDSGGSSDPGAGGSSEPAPQEECSCEPTGDNYCEPKQITCTSDDDCPKDWTCESPTDDSAPCAFDPQTGETDCVPPSDPQSYCIPPNWGAWGASEGSYKESVDRAASGQAPLNELSDDTSEKGDSGCMFAGRSAGRSAGLPGAAWLLLVLGLILVARRRSA